MRYRCHSSIASNINLLMPYVKNYEEIKRFSLIRSIRKLKITYTRHVLFSITTEDIIRYASHKPYNRFLSPEIHECKCGNDLCEGRIYVLGYDDKADWNDTYTAKAYFCRSCKSLVNVENNKLIDLEFERPSDV